MNTIARHESSMGKKRKKTKTFDYWYMVLLSRKIFGDLLLIGYGYPAALSLDFVRLLYLSAALVYWSIEFHSLLVR